jgi:hypothetical protein
MAVAGEVQGVSAEFCGGVGEEGAPWGGSPIIFILESIPLYMNYSITYVKVVQTFKVDNDSQL